MAAHHANLFSGPTDPALTDATEPGDVWVDTSQVAAGYQPAVRTRNGTNDDWNWPSLIRVVNGSQVLVETWPDGTISLASLGAVLTLSPDGSGSIANGNGGVYLNTDGTFNGTPA